jgi:hypothetical protein
MTKNEIRAEIQRDIERYRAKANTYDTLHLYEAASYARKLATNLELALTTMPRDEDPQIA